MSCVSTCLHHAVDIQRRLAPRDWPAALQRVPEECRDECAAYFAELAKLQRMRRERKAARKRAA